MLGLALKRDKTKTKIPTKKTFLNMKSKFEKIYNSFWLSVISTNPIHWRRIPYTHGSAGLGPKASAFVSLWKN